MASSLPVALTVAKLASASGTHPHVIRADYDERRDQLVAGGAHYAEAEAAALAYVVDKFSDLAEHLRRTRGRR